MLAEFKKSVSLIIEKFPQHKEDIQASYQLALDEIVFLKEELERAKK